MSHDREVVRYYTRSRRFQHVLGRLPDGTKIPGGPYTLTQVVGAGAVMAVGAQTMSIWGTSGGLTNVVLLMVATVVTAKALGRVRTGTRGPMAVVLGGVAAAAAPPLGRLHGRPVTLSRPRRLSHHVVVRSAAPQPCSGSSEADDSPAGDPPSAPLTGIQAALAKAAQQGVQ